MKPLKIGVYIRVSTEDQVNVFEGSLDSQKHRIDEFVQYKNRQQRGWGEIIEYYIEEGLSAGTTNRPMYQKIMSDVRKSKVNLILVSDLTRLSRNLLDFCTLINELEEHKASYLSMKEQFDTSTPIGRMMVYIIIALGQFEREQTSERVAVNGHSRAMRGLVNGGPAILGFNKHPEKPGLLQVNEAEAEIVRIIFQTFLEEGSRAKTASKLNAIGIYPKRTSKRAKANAPAKWTVQSLGKLIENVGFIGLREVNKVYKHEDESYLKPWQKHGTVKATWPAIMDEKTFYDAQKLLLEASEKERTRHSAGETRLFLLTGLLTCGETGLPLVGQAGHSSSGVVHRYYHYARKPKDVTQVRPRLNAVELEEKVLTEFRSALLTKGYFDDLGRTFQQYAKAKSAGQSSERERTQKSLNLVVSEIKSVWENQARMQLSDESLLLASEEMNRLATRKKELEKYLTSLGPEVAYRRESKKSAQFVESQIRWCLQGWTKASGATKKRLLRRTIKCIVVNRSEMHIIFWESPQERDDAFLSADEPDSANDTSDKKLRRLSPPNSSFSSRSSHQNLSIACSGKVDIGSERRT